AGADGAGDAGPARGRFRRRRGPAMTIEELGKVLRARETSAEEITERCLQRIEADNARLNAFILVMADQARQQAQALDRELAAGRDRGPLHGVPISIKDLFDVRGTPTTAASRVRDGHVASRDAVIVAHLRQAGAVLVGKTNLHEFALGTTNEDSAYGPARNPYDDARSPDGSKTQWERCATAARRFVTWTSATPAISQRSSCTSACPRPRHTMPGRSKRCRTGTRSR